MHDLDLLVPSALVDPGLAAELLRDRALPSLQRILAFAAATNPPRPSDDASLTTWQGWVFAHRADVEPARVNVAELAAMACGLAPATGRYLAEPAHFTIAKDHLRLDDPRALAITLPEARALAASIAPVLAEAGWRLDPIEPATLAHWPMTTMAGSPLVAPSIERAIGDNVAAWQPRSGRGDDAALDWRRCVNEIQMSWFDHPVNAAREAAGRPTINTLWLSGNGAPRAPLPAYAAVDSGLPLLAALPIEPDATRTLMTFDDFMQPARAEDWSGWREALEPFERSLARLLQRQSAGTIGIVTLVLCGRDEARAFTLASRDRMRFWRGWGRAPSLVDTFCERVR